MNVSIITTCFNAQNSIEKTIKSVLSQNYSDFEYIIQDGGSTDDTEKICRSFMQAFKDKNIPFNFYSEKDSGIYDGMNKGVEKAVGKYINFMNADDVFYDENVLANVFESVGGINNNISYNNINYNSVSSSDDPGDGDASNDITNVIITNDIHSSEPDIIYGDAVEFECGNYYKYNKDINRIKRAMPFSHQSVFAKRTLLLEYPFDKSFSIGADYDFLLTAYLDGYNFYDCGKFICIVSRDGKSSRDLYNTFIETVKIQQYHGINNYTDLAYKKKLFSLKLKQFAMDKMPEPMIDKIRLVQRKLRKQNETVDVKIETDA